MEETKQIVQLKTRNGTLMYPVVDAAAVFIETDDHELTYIKEYIDRLETKLNQHINPECAPVWTAATASLSGSTTLEVGSNMPAESTFVASGSLASAGGASSGAPTDTITTTVAFGTKVSSPTTATVTLNRVYAESSEQVKTNYGNPTTKTASVANTLLENALVNSYISTTTFKITAIPLQATANVYFVYPIWLNGTKKTSTKTSYEETKAISATSVFTFRVPSSYGVVLKYYDSVALKWSDSLTLTSSNVSEETLTGGVKKSYTTYTYSEPSTELKFNLTFTVA